VAVCRVLAITILAVDVLLVVVQLALKEEFPVLVEELIEVLTLLFSAFFCGEVALRIIGQGSASQARPHSEDLLPADWCSSSGGLKSWTWW
jgi:hypothetical protein